VLWAGATERHRHRNSAEIVSNRAASAESAAGARSFSIDSRRNRSVESRPPGARTLDLASEQKGTTPPANPSSRRGPQMVRS